MDALGNHILVEFSGCNPDIMNDVIRIENAMIEAAEKAGATVINSTFHHFSPYGVSGVVVIQESHLAIHSWPEYGYAAVDLFTCGQQIDPWISFDYLKEVFEGKDHSTTEMKRGSRQLLNQVDYDLKTMREQVRTRENPQKYNRNVWFTDKDDNQALSLRHTGEMLYEYESAYQKIKILESYKYGKMLILDDMVMTTEQDEFHYHEMISHPAMFVHDHAKKILVIGGGDGGTLKELIKHESVEQIDLVEIDEAVIEACQKYLPDIASAFDHKKVNLKVEDGVQYVQNSAKQQYDLVIVDGSDAVGPAEGLYTDGFYKNCHRILNNDGLLVAQSVSPSFHPKAFSELNQVLCNLFYRTDVFLFYVPSYPTGLWSFQCASKTAVEFHAIDDQVIDAFEKQHQLQYYNASVHQSSLALPGFVRKLLRS